MSEPEPPTPTRPRRRAVHAWMIGIAVALLCAFALATAYAFLEQRFPDALARWPTISIGDTTRYIRDSGKWGMAVSIGLMVAHSFIPLPSEPITLANGRIYGALMGGVITWIGAMLGAQAAYWPARGAGRIAIGRRLDPARIERITRWVDAHGVLALLGLRLLPMVSFNAVNYVAGLANVPWWTFTWTTGLGIVPFTALLVVMGDETMALSAEMWAGLAGIAAIVLLVAWRLRRRWAS